MSRYRAVFSAFVVLSAFSIAVPPAGAGQGRGRGSDKKVEKAEKHEHKADHKDAKKDGKKSGPGSVVVDRDGHIRIIREYAHGGSLPPGLAKRESLPPGLRRQLIENGALPPGLQKRLVLVPAPLGARLPPVPAYYRRYFAGDDLIVVDTRTNRVIAIIRDVWR